LCPLPHPHRRHWCIWQALVDAREAAARERERMTELEQWEASRMQRHEALREARRRREEHEEQRRQRDEEART
jgi:hypothetical protein